MAQVIRSLTEKCISIINNIAEPTVLMKCLSTIPRIPEIFMKMLLKHNLENLEYEYSEDSDLLKCGQCLLSFWPREEICLNDILDGLEYQLQDFPNIFFSIHEYHEMAGGILLRLFGNVITSGPHHLKSFDISTCLLDNSELQEFLDKYDPILSECGNKQYKLTISLSLDADVETCEKSYPWLDLRVKHVTFSSNDVLPKNIPPEALQYLTSVGIYIRSCDTCVGTAVTPVVLQEFESMSIKPTITSLGLLEACIMSPDDERLKPLLQGFTSLRKLLILYTHQHLTAILCVINQPITHLALVECKVENELISQMCGMENLHALEYLDLSRNNLEGFHNIVTFISKIKNTLKSLKLQCTGLKDQILIDICEQLTESHNELTIDLEHDDAVRKSFPREDRRAVKITMLGILPPNSQVIVDDIMDLDSDSCNDDYYYAGYSSDDSPL